MRLPPLLASLTRHKLTVALMLLATALTCAIVTNVAAMIVHRATILNQPSGLNEATLVTFDSTRIDANDPSGSNSEHDRWPQYQADLAVLKGITGVESTAVVSGLPLAGGMVMEVTTQIDAKQGAGFEAAAYSGGPGELRTLDLRLMRGRDFLPPEYLPSDNLDNLDKVSAAIISATLARRLFHTKNAVGRLFYSSHHPIRVVGVIDQLMGMRTPGATMAGEQTMLLPLEPNGARVTFVLRTKPADRGRVLRRAMSLLGDRDPQRIFDDGKTFTQIRAQYFRRDSSMIGMLLTSGIILLIVTFAGVAGLASFWVQQRTRSIGIRRAVGATRADILRYFQAENFMILTGGVVLGCVLAYGLNLLLMNYYGVRLLPPSYLAVGALALWVMGQIAVLGPAAHAAVVSPVVATQSV